MKMTDKLDFASAREKTDVLWFPTHGDGRYLGSEIGARHVSLSYLSQIAQAADDLGYYNGVLLPTGRSCEDTFGHCFGDGSSRSAAAFPCRGAAGPHRTGLCRAHSGHA